MLYHPTLVMLIASAILAICYRQKKIFNIIAIFTPFAAIIMLKLGASDTISLKLVKYSLSAHFTEANQLFGKIILLVLPCIHLYAIARKKKLELIVGNLYASFALFCVFANDFLSMFIGIECMMITSSIIIFIGGKKDSLKDAKQYFITHLVSSSMILIGIAHIMMTANETSITTLFNDDNLSPVFLNIMLLGFIINIAAFPFSGWMINCYSSASTTGFVYLISFTTKINTLLIIKLFNGYESLQYVGIIMILYAGIKAILENHLLKLLCYFSIIQMGFILIVCSMTSLSTNMILLIIIFLLTHLTYKTLLSICCATLIDHYNISTCHEMQNTNSQYLNTALLIGVFAMIPIPMMHFNILEYKYIITHEINNNLINWFLYFTTIPAIIIALPIKSFLHNKSRITKKSLNIYNILSICIISIILLMISIIAPYTPPSFNYDYQYIIIKYGAIICISGIISYINPIPKIESKAMNIIDVIGHYFFFHFDKWDIKSHNKFHFKEYYLPLIQQYMHQIKLAHSQKIAIYLVFTIFLLLLIVFLTQISQ